MRSRLRALPSNDRIFADAIRNSRVVLGGSGGPNVRADLDAKLPVTGLADVGEEPQPFMFQFPGVLRNVPVQEGRPGAACSPSSPSVTASLSAACR